MCRANTQFVEQRLRIVRHLADGVRFVRLIAPSRASVVERDHLILTAESGYLRPPASRVRSEPHDQHERLAPAVDLIVEIDPVYSRERHTAGSFRSGFANDSNNCGG